MLGPNNVFMESPSAQLNAFDPVVIRAAQIEDAPAISNLIISSIHFYHSTHYTPHELTIWRQGYTAAKVREQIRDRQCLVILVGDTLAGVVQFEKPEIKGFYINPSFRRQGLGSSLLQDMLSRLASQGHTAVELTSNKWVVQFYEKHGFSVLGAEEVYWDNHPFWEYRMVKPLEIATGP